jgi:HAE1 family hydrophobic/amphiphilic exporter-1
MLCSRFLRASAVSHDPRLHGRLYAWSERVFEGMKAFYDRTLRVALRHRLSVVAVALLMAVLTVVVGKRLPQGFIPTDDAGVVLVMMEAAQDVSFDEMVRHQQAAAAILAQQPYVEAFMSSMGASPTGAVSANSNQGRLFMRLKPRGQRPPIGAIVADLRQKLSVVPGLRVYPQVPPTIRVGGQLTKALYQFTLTGGDLRELYAVSDSMEKNPGDPGARRRQFRPANHQPAAPRRHQPRSGRHDGNHARADRGRALQRVRHPPGFHDLHANQPVFVVMEVAQEFQRDASALSLIYVRARNGKLVPLDAVAALRRDVGPLTVNHLGQMPAVTISFNLKPGVSLGDATAAIEKLARAELPSTVNYSFVGSAQAFASSMKGMGLLLTLAVVVIYIVLGVLYEDFIHPLTILSGLPAASFGALFTLWLFGQELNIMGYVGVILLVGIVKKNAIMMIDFAIAVERQEGPPSMRSGRSSKPASSASAQS